MCTRLAAAVLTAGLAVAALAGCSTPGSTNLSELGSTGPAATSSAPCTSNYHAGVQSVDMTIQNNTGQVLILDSGHTGRADIGHWGAQPPTTLAPGACAELTGYSDSPIGDFYLTATYRLPNGTYIPFSVDSGSDSYNGLVFTASGMSGVSTGGMSGQQDFDWVIDNPTHSGTMHVHYTLVAQAAATTS